MQLNKETKPNLWLTLAAYPYQPISPQDAIQCPHRADEYKILLSGP